MNSYLSMLGGRDQDQLIARLENCRISFISHLVYIAELKEELQANLEMLLPADRVFGHARNQLNFIEAMTAWLRENISQKPNF